MKKLMNNNNKSWARMAAGAALALCAATAAQADPYNFVVTGDYSASWQMDSSPTPDDWGDGFRFVLSDYPGNFPGSTNGTVSISFYSDGAGGGMVLNDLASFTMLLNTASEQLYTGTEAAPTFKLGSFAMTGWGDGTEYTLTISNAAAVPEPESYALMLGGLGLVGMAVARRRKS